MTLLNTIVNLAGTWTGTLALWLVDSASFKDCEGVTDYRLDCDTLQELKVCAMVATSAAPLVGLGRNIFIGFLYCSHLDSCAPWEQRVSFALVV